MSFGTPRRTSRQLTSLIAITGALVVHSHAHSQDVAGAQIGEIIVTAQKRSQSVQDVPATIAVLGAQAVEERQIGDLTDITSQVPSLVVGNFFGTSLISLRGISTGITSGAEDPSVALHIDGVYQPRQRTLDIASIDLERIEVLSGPQGTLYGRNATGGVINYILMKPSREFEGNVSATVANYDRFAFKGAVSGPITDNLQVRIAGIYDDQNRGFIKNLQPGAPQKTIETRRAISGRFALAYQPIDALAINAQVLYSDYEGSSAFSSFAPTTDPFFAGLLQPTTSEPHRIYANSRAELKGKITAPSLTVQWDASDNVSLKSITGYTKFDDREFLDSDASGASILVSDLQNDTATWTQELNLNVSSFNGKMKSIFGAFYFNDRLTITARPDFGFIVVGTLIPFFYETRQKAKSYAVFMDHTYSVTDALRVQVGARYNVDRKESFASIFAFGTELCGVGVKKKFKAFTPRAGVQYDFSPNLMAYVQWQKGFKAGGVASQSCSDEYDPEKIQGFEAGVKGDLFDRRLTFAAAAYNYKVSDLQVQQFTGIVLDISNAARARIYGFELSGQAVLTDWLRADLAANVQEAKYKQYSNCDAMVFLGACGAGDPRPLSERFVNLKGNRLNRAPPYTVNLGLEAHKEFESFGSLKLRGELYWSGKVNYDEFENPELTQRAYMTANAYLNYSTPSDRYHLRAFAKNITNKDIKTAGLGLAGAAQTFVGSWAPPRTYGIEAAMNF
jgi:iron complex outermembrane recepter protein